jgi:Cd2+/Zn2+-exporting ATPase
MPHDFVKDVVEAESGKAGLQVVAALVGGVLLANSLVAGVVFDHDAYGALLAMVAAILLGAPLVWQALADLWHGRMEMNELAALAVVAAFATGEYATAAAIAFFMIISVLIEYRSALGARRSIESLIRLTPAMAVKLTSTGETQVAANDLGPGDVVRVKPGDSIPGDGRVVSGSSTVNEATITGESIPVDKSACDEVFGGTINLTGMLDVEITTAAEDTTLSKVKQLILQAEKSRTPIMRMVDRYATWYTPIVLMLAAMVLFFTRDMSRAISMIVIACPCAIILSAPTAVVAALSAAARLGVLVKNVVDLETAKNITSVVLDKTGTLTTGELSVSRLSPAEDGGDAALLATAAAVEQYSKHPVARAVLRAARDRELRVPDAEGFEESSGRGVRAMVAGSEILVGRGPWLHEHGVDVLDADIPDAEGLSILHVTRDGRPVGWIGLEDRTRPDAARAVDDLRAAGAVRLVMVTGDRWSVARRVAGEMHCTDVLAEVLPAQKLEIVAGLKEQGHTVAVVGDGVNDAPALAAGHISIAMGAAGSDVAIHSASIALMNNNLNRIPFLVRLSRRTMDVIRQNLSFAVTYIAVFLCLTALGYVGPIWAVLLHTASSFGVVFNSARLVRQGEDVETPELTSGTSRPRVAPVPVSAT